MSLPKVIPITTCYILMDKQFPIPSTFDDLGEFVTVDFAPVAFRNEKPTSEVQPSDFLAAIRDGAVPIWNDEQQEARL
jgi:hypothetical protein